MIPSNLKTSRCHCAALSLPVMGAEEMRRVPRLPGRLADEFREKLSAIADQAPHAHTAVQARELMESLPRVPVDGHEMYTAGAGEVDQAYVGICRREVSGLWSWHITTPGGKVVDDEYGYHCEPDAQADLDLRLDELNLLEGVA